MVNFWEAWALSKGKWLSVLLINSLLQEDR